MTMNTGQQGFSLLEMLVALALFALIGVAGLTLVQTVLNAQDGTETRLARLGQVQRAFYLIGADLQQAAPASLVIQDGALVFTRRNLEERQISIAYSLGGGILIRTIDAARPQAVLADVASATWRFHFAGVGWLETVRREDHRLPDGIELDLATKGEGTLRRVVDLMSAP
jgi:general secretion pathway protein J